MDDGRCALSIEEEEPTCAVARCSLQAGSTKPVIPDQSLVDGNGGLFVGCDVLIILVQRPTESQVHQYSIEKLGALFRREHLLLGLDVLCLSSFLLLLLVALRVELLKLVFYGEAPGHLAHASLDVATRANDP